MALNSSGPISLGGATLGQSINLELGQAATATASINAANFRSLAGVASGQISLSSFYGKSSATYYLFTSGVLDTQIISGVISDSSSNVYSGTTGDGNNFLKLFKIGPTGTVLLGRVANSGGMQTTTSRPALTPNGVMSGGNPNGSTYGGFSTSTFATVRTFNTGVTGSYQYIRCAASVSDPSSNIYMGGQAYYDICCVGQGDAPMVVKYNSSLARQASVIRSSGANGGAIWGIDYDPVGGGVVATGQGNYSGSKQIVVKFNSSLSATWVRSLNTYQGTYYRSNVAVSSSGNIVATSGTESALGYVTVLNSSGTFLWGKTLGTGGGGAGSVAPRGCCFDSAGNVYIYGVDGNQESPFKRANLFKFI